MVNRLGEDIRQVIKFTLDRFNKVLVGFQVKDKGYKPGRVVKYMFWVGWKKTDFCLSLSEMVGGSI